jgi:ABC-type uncharacterized transport system involved in gliding motility auxiliary subunit
MKVLGQVLGAIGLVFVLSTPVMLFAVGGGWNWLFTVQVILGALFVATYLFTNVGEVGRIASGRGTFYVVFTGVSTAAVLGLVVAGNYLAYKAEIRRDLTEARIFTLAPDSVQTVKALPGPVEILAFYRSDTPEYQFLEDMVSRYRQHSDRIAISSVDPDRDPERVRAHNINLRGNRVVVRMGDRSDRMTDLSEEALTNALVRLTRGASKRVYFTVGHGEASLEDEQSERGLSIVRDLMVNEGLEAEPLRLTDAVPQDAAAVVVAGPQRPFLQPEVAILAEYLEQGGRMLVLLEPMVDSGLEALLERYAIGIEDDLIVDQNRITQFMGPFVTMAASYSQHEITEAFGAQLTLFTTARSLFPLPRDDVRRPLPLVLTGEGAWGAKQYREQPIRYVPETDRRGPLPLALVTYRGVDGRYSDEMRLVVFGDADFATNGWADQAANGDLFLNSLNWMVEQVDRITIRPRQRTASQIFLTENQSMFLRMFSINLLPLFLAAVGVAVWVLRKNR